MSLDCAIQSFRLPVGPGVNVSNIGFHTPPQEPGWPNDGTFNNQGYSSTPRTVDQTAASITWETETFAQNQNANAIRCGTLYNFRFDADQPPQATSATVDFFKTGSPITVAIQAPAGGGAPTPTPTPTPTVTPSPTPTATPRSTPNTADHTHTKVSAYAATAPDASALEGMAPNCSLPGLRLIGVSQNGAGGRRATWTAGTQAE